MFLLSEPGRQALLSIAREAVHSYLLHQSLSVPDVDSSELTEPHAVFVSIHKDHALRGCIGSIAAAEPLFRSTAECAVKAAVGDPRFAPMVAAELPLVTFEISVLSDMELVNDVRDIQVGAHGLMITKGEFRGLLLPQVASQYHWDREQFLRETCRKAELAPDEWTKGTATIHCFTAHIFREEHVAHPSNP